MPLPSNFCDSPVCNNLDNSTYFWFIADESLTLAFEHFFASKRLDDLEDKLKEIKNITHEIEHKKLYFSISIPFKNISAKQFCIQNLHIDLLGCKLLLHQVKTSAIMSNFRKFI